MEKTSLRDELREKTNAMLEELISSGMQKDAAKAMVSKYFGDESLNELEITAENAFGKGQRRASDDGLVVGKIYRITSCNCKKAHKTRDGKGLPPVWTSTYNYKGKSRELNGTQICNHVGQLVRVTKTTPQGRKRMQMIHDRHRQVLLYEAPSPQNPTGAELNVQIRQFAWYHTFEEVGSWADLMHNLSDVHRLGKDTEKDTEKSSSK